MGEIFCVKTFWVKFFFDPRPTKGRGRGDGGEVGDGSDGGDGGDGVGEVDQGEVSTIRLGMLESSGFRKYSTLLVIQFFSWSLCLCICVPNSFLNSYYHKLSENVWVLESGATRNEIWTGVTIAGQQPNNQTTEQGKIGPLSQWTMEG